MLAVADPSARSAAQAAAEPAGPAVVAELAVAVPAPAGAAEISAAAMPAGQLAGDLRLGSVVAPVAVA